MEDYYKLYNCNINDPIDKLNYVYKRKIEEYKAKPFLIDSDKKILKEYHKAHFIFNNDKYKKIYDEYIQKKMYSKKNNNNPNYIVDRIFDTNGRKTRNVISDELLRPKNVGLSSDKEPEFDIPLDFEKTENILPYNFDS